MAVHSSDTVALGLALALNLPLAAAQPGALEERAAALFTQLPPPRQHFVTTSPEEWSRKQAHERNYRAFLREKIAGRWFAVLVEDEQGDEPFRIKARFESLPGLFDFLLEQEALVETWAYGEGGAGAGRRLSAPERVVLNQEPRAQPTLNLVIYHDPEAGRVVTNRLEFGLEAAQQSWEAQQGYWRQRRIQLVAREVLSAQDFGGRMTAVAQWEAMIRAILEGRLPQFGLPSQPGASNDLFLAFEYAVDEFNNIARIVRVYRESEIDKKIVRDDQGRATQILVLQQGGRTPPRRAFGFKVRGVGDQLERAPSPIPGRDAIELRVENPEQPDVRRWNVLEFGEPQLIAESALARFSLLSAHLERQRKTIALRKSKADLIAEPIIAGLNIGGGVAGWGFPAGAAARLAYNLITPKFIADVPSAKELRELFAWLAAKERHPRLSKLAPEFLSQEDIAELEESSRRLSAVELEEYLRRVSDEDLEAMLWLARMKRGDAGISNFLNILAGVGKVTGETESGVLRDIFNSPYFSVSGDINIKTIVAVLAGAEEITSLSGVSLESLAKGEGPAEAWLQFLEFSVDVRAVFNTLFRLPRKTYATKELYQPFPYAARMSDLAAYEIRLFGYPLLIFYKRGLLKDDYRAFVEDYAYGVDGEKLVEHFKTKEEMHREILAGRMVPIGYVKVPTLRGKWRDTDLPVFAHRMPSRKGRGRMVLVIYGLAAFAEQSWLLERELQRFRQHEQALQEGAVIEQLVQAEDEAELPAEAFEPRIHTGPEAVDRLYSRLLAELLEVGRYWWRHGRGLPLEAADLDLVATILEDLAARGIWLEDGDALAGVDRFQSSFLYRRTVNGHRRLVKMTLIPGLATIERGLHRAAEARQVEQLRREGLSPEGEGIAFMNQARERNGRYEVGPLLENGDGQVLGAGVRSGPKALEALFTLIDQLAVADQARLHFNRFASTLVELDSDGDGQRENVFLTLEFPPDRALRRERTNPRTGEREVLSYENGRWTGTATDRRLLRIEHDDQGQETASRLYFNAGNRREPVMGPLLAETRTVAWWTRDLNQPDLDPYLPLLAKLKADFVTGRFSSETYGLFPEPVSEVDERLISQNRFNPHGILESTLVLQNGREESDFERTLLPKLMQPVAGRERWRLTSTLPPRQLADLSNLREQGFRTVLEQRDLVKGVSRTVILDQANFGRQIVESHREAVDATDSFSIQKRREYRDDFHFGLIPFGTSIRGGPEALLLAETETKSYDPVLRRLTGVETDYTGQIRTKIWDHRWDNPVVVETALRLTTNHYDYYETTVTGQTLSKDSGERVASFTGQFDSETHTWAVTRRFWFEPGIALRTQTETLSPLGTLLSIRNGDLYESRPTYSSDGRETAKRSFRFNPASGRFDLPHCVEDQYQWNHGERTAQVHTYVEGQPYDTFARVTDPEGRLRIDGWRQLPGATFRTVLTCDGASERLRQTVAIQNDQVREQRLYLPRQPQAEGTNLLRVQVIPSWGLTCTQIFVIGDPLARPLAVVFANGETARARQWFQDTDLAEVLEIADRHGRVKEVLHTQLNAGTDQGIPYDLVTRSRRGFWAQTGLAAKEAVLRGTAIPLFEERNGRRIYYDLDKPYPAPWFGVDPQGQRGLALSFGGQNRSNVLALFQARLGPQPEGSPLSGEPVLLIDEVDPLSLYDHRVSRQAWSRSGDLLEELTGHIPRLRPGELASPAAISNALSRFQPGTRFQHRYRRGWLVAEQERPATGRTLRFTEEQPAGDSAILVNDREPTELVTGMEGVRYVTGGDPEARNLDHYTFRRLRNPRWLERNPYLPGRADVWTAWTSTELDIAGQTLYEAELVYDAQGSLAAAKTTKLSSRGQAATKINYRIPHPDPPELQEVMLGAETKVIPLVTSGQSDFSRSDFLYFYAENATNAAWHLQIQDASRNQVLVRPDNESSPGKTFVSPWVVHPAHTQWLPDQLMPRRSVTLTAPEALLQAGSVVVISVHDLEKAQLDVRRLTAFDFFASSSRPAPLRLSPLYTLDGRGQFIPDHDKAEHKVEVLDHACGLKTLTIAEEDRTDLDRQAGRRMISFVEWNRLPVAFAQARSRHAEFPHLILLDNSQADWPLPLYALSGKNGRLLEHYKVLHRGDTRIYTVVQGFDLPKLEVFSARTLGDELEPSFLAYGNEHQMAVPLARGEGWFGHGMAALHNRIAANIFRLAGSRLLRLFIEEDPAIELLRYFNESSLHDAAGQAREINQLPMLAEALVSTPQPRWDGDELLPETRLNTDWDSVRFTLDQSHLVYPEPQSGLIPTSPGTFQERYVDTVAEAALIVLAIELDELALARDLLGFYWEKSQGGRQALHASYDADAGTAMTVDLVHKRPVRSRRTAEAQLAIADAAFHLAARTGDPKWLTLGRNLTTVVLDEFRPALPAHSSPRGITAYKSLAVRQAYGFTLWPPADEYSLRANARAYLLLKQLDDLIRRRVLDSHWQFQIREALVEQERWLQRHVFPLVERSGVVPTGLFQIQDVHRGTTALAAERWTATADWLAVLEAGHAMGLPAESIRHWLDNLARVHGVQVRGSWGLDWGLPLLRADAIVPELTAHFMRVAERVGHAPAARFARQNLAVWQHSNSFPAAITARPPDQPVQSGEGRFVSPKTNAPEWSLTLLTHAHLIDQAWDKTNAAPLDSTPVREVWKPRRTDLAVFVLITAGSYLLILGSAVFWWSFRSLRRRQNQDLAPDRLVSKAVMQRAEERWAQRVLGLQVPANAERSRFSNATVEANFLMHLRAIYGLTVEWRRLENGWDEDDPRLTGAESDVWLNGLDEFVSVVAIYMRWVIKAGAKDGFAKLDVLEENEDSNHIWSRLVMYFSEHHWTLLTALDHYKNLVSSPERANLSIEFGDLLTSMGLTPRTTGFDARTLFNFPVNPAAMDLLMIQKPGVTLKQIVAEASGKLGISQAQIVQVIRCYKQFKRREKPYPIHPHLLECAKVLPHFLFMGVGAVVSYNQLQGDSPIVPYLWSVVTKLALAPVSLLWALPLLGGVLCAVLASLTRVYRFETPILPRGQPRMFFDATLTSFFAKRHSLTPHMKHQRRWNPAWYDWIGWALRLIGLLGLGLTLCRLDTPSFATFLVVKGLLAMLFFLEAAAVVWPLATSLFSRALQDWVSGHPRSGPFLRFVNTLNITSTRPASPSWLSLRYHLQPSVPSGGPVAIAQSVAFYFLLAAAFFFGGGFVCQQILSLWFEETYLAASNWKLFVGGIVFWNTMYLLRYGLFLFLTGLAALVATFPVKGTFGLLALMDLGLLALGESSPIEIGAYPELTFALLATGLILSLFERQVRAALQGTSWLADRRRKREETVRKKLEKIKSGADPLLGVVYMSGDELSSQKLTPKLLLERWKILRDKLGSEGSRLLLEMVDCPDDETLERRFEALTAAEQRAGVTLWHPMQLCLAGERPQLRPELGLHLVVETAVERRLLLQAWHARRWLVTMMSSAGHSQDTAISLVDIALRLGREGLGRQTVFYLIQNKYDNQTGNRPCQCAYDQGELGQRNKLARLLSELAPGAEAYSLQNWTPFGFKAGGLTAMDLVPEAALELKTMLLLDRNATVHDLDALLEDLTRALTNPDVIIVIPGRGTTNVGTPLGQASQLVEEGHRSFLRGLMAWLGGKCSESVGTGWGNLLAVSHGEVQCALLNPSTPKRPLTSRMRRGSSFAVRAEGLIGFAPHAVGISEDTWAVSQATHNALALGRSVRFLLSRAMWHKMRETWSHAEWLASFPRWSGGYLQMMHDPIMQQINDLGPLSVFAKETRSNSGRCFLTAPFALLNILCMPLAILLDVTPFVQILIILWNFGFVMNQVLTFHALNTYLESRGFYRIPALIGMCASAAWCYFTPSLHLAAPGLIMLGFLTGGFFVGISRWLCTRLRDMILFGPQLVLQALGQFVRQTLEFVVSGASPQDAKTVNMAYRSWAGPREDRPLEGFANFINLRTVVWGAGFISVILNLFALSSLDMLNVLLLLPSLLFSVSLLVGPFLSVAPPRKLSGLRLFFPRALGWLASFGSCMVVSLLVPAGGWQTWAGSLALIAVLGLLLTSGLRYFGYRKRWHRAGTELRSLLAGAGLEKGKLDGAAGSILAQAGSQPHQLQAVLDQAGIAPGAQGAVTDLVRRRMQPLLQKVSATRRDGCGAGSPFASELRRALVLSLFVFVWFFIVPVPGLFTFSTGDYRISIQFTGIVLLLCWIVGLALAGKWAGNLLQQSDYRLGRSRSLRSRLLNAYARFQTQAEMPGQLSPEQVSSIYALLTDLQTYLDQRSLAYAWRCLRQIEAALGLARI